MSKKSENDKAIQEMMKVLQGQRDDVWSSNHQRALKDLQKRRSKNI